MQPDTPANVGPELTGTDVAPGVMGRGCIRGPYFNALSPHFGALASAAALSAARAPARMLDMA